MLEEPLGEEEWSVGGVDSFSSDAESGAGGVVGTLTDGMKAKGSQVQENGWVSQFERYVWPWSSVADAAKPEIVGSLALTCCRDKRSAVSSSGRLIFCCLSASRSTSIYPNTGSTASGDGPKEDLAACGGGLVVVLWVTIHSFIEPVPREDCKFDMS